MQPLGEFLGGLQPGMTGGAQDCHPHHSLRPLLGLEQTPQRPQDSELAQKPPCHSWTLSVSPIRSWVGVKVASEKTEKLLNKVLGGESASVNAETLLSQAVEQLRQATQVLQEIRDLEEMNREAPGLREKRRELVTLYRRSVP